MSDIFCEATPINEVAGDSLPPNATEPSTRGRPGAGFPSSTDYLSEGMNHLTATQWPNAQKQLNTFFEARNMAELKLLVFPVPLPGALGCWWVRSWADEFLWRTVEGIYASVADVRALYQFGRTLDQMLRLTGTPLGDNQNCEAEFIYYKNPLLRGGPNGTAVPEPFGRCVFDHRITDQNLPTFFPGQSKCRPFGEVWLDCEEFLTWGAFLATPDALTAQQTKELGHIEYSEGGTRTHGEHGKQCGVFAKKILTRLRDSIVIVSDSLQIGGHHVAEGMAFAEALTGVSQWLVEADAKLKSDAATASPVAKGVSKIEPVTPLVDAYTELRQFADDELPTLQRAVVMALCDAKGRLPLEDLALCKGVDWDDAVAGWKNVKRKLDPKLNKRKFKLYRKRNCAFLRPIKSSVIVGV
jgi:hypothetical protein